MIPHTPSTTQPPNHTSNTHSKPPMSKKKAHYCSVNLLWKNSPYVTIDFYDNKQRVLRSSVDVVLNLDYHDENSVNAFLTSR